MNRLQMLFYFNFQAGRKFLYGIYEPFYRVIYQLIDAIKFLLIQAQFYSK